MGNNKLLGAYGEDIACDYLVRKGYRVLERNFTCRAGEVDIIAMHGDIVVFVEVKTRRSEKFGLPSEAVSAAKQNRIVKTALYYMQSRRLLEHMCRFDVIEVSAGEDNKPLVNLIQDAFQYSGRYEY